MTDNIVAILSMLHERPGRDSATRLFRCEPVLAWTLRRLRQATAVHHAAILCWDDQAVAARHIAEESGATVYGKGERSRLPTLDAVAAARRWTDGWRGGLLGTCDFDLGFHALWTKDISDEAGGSCVVLVDPAAALVDPDLINGLVEHARHRPTSEMIFSPAAPGLSGVLLRPELLERLNVSLVYPGRMLHYSPDESAKDPIGGDGCTAIPTPAARTTRRFKIDSDRQHARIALATEPLNGQLITTGAEGIVRRVETTTLHDDLPREVRLELNTNRATSPIFWPGKHLSISRPPIALDVAKRLIGDIAASDDVRLTLAGVGDPLLCERVFDVIDAAKCAGIEAISIETDLLDVSPESLTRLAAAPLDVICIHLPAMTAQTYGAVMGVNAYVKVLENFQHFVEQRARRASLVPLVVPVFTKCQMNLGEMEAWYDQWIRAVGSAVIDGPSVFAGQIADVAVADMSPPRRGACARLSSRMSVLCDGHVVACEQDVLGRHVMGEIGRESVRDVWRRVGAMRADHQAGKWTKFPLCGACKEWHRP
jgi:hypothetical protein